MKNKKILISIVAIVIIIAFIYFFLKSDYKSINLGNTNIKSAESIKEYILNISSYEADISLEITSNRTTNKYKMIQKYVSPNIFKQEVLEPNNIKGLTTTYDGTNLKIENTSIALSKIYENYNYISENSLCLNSFIEEYKKSNNAKYDENQDCVILKLKSEDTNNKYSVYKTLYIDKKTLKPTKMEIEEVNKKMLVYILYNKIEINSINKEEVLAFK